MLQVTAQSKIFLAIQPVDFRKGIDGLCALCRLHLKQEPYSGSIFVFRNRRGTALKMLAYDGQGMWLCLKRFSQGTIHWWPKHEESLISLKMSELQILLWNGYPHGARIPEDWRQID